VTRRGSLSSVGSESRAMENAESHLGEMALTALMAPGVRAVKSTKSRLGHVLENSSTMNPFWVYLIRLASDLVSVNSIMTDSRAWCPRSLAPKYSSQNLPGLALIP
jgi:hypothetical protein